MPDHVLGGLLPVVSKLQTLRNLDEEGKHRLKRRLNKGYHSRLSRREYNPEGVDVFAEEWDNLIILDACRFDAIERHHSRGTLPGKLTSKTSRGSFTPEWLKANFDGRDLTDTVYVTGMPMPYRLGVLEEAGSMFPQYSFDLRVHDIVNVWKTHGKPLAPDDDVNIIVDPDDVVAAAIETQETYPDKRLIVHVVQPHDPYVGPAGRALPTFPWERKMYDQADISVEELRRAYRENVDIAVESIRDLLPELRGLTVVSSDHGELLWERSFPVPFIDFKHTSRTYVDALVTVPWLEYQRGPRKEVSRDPPPGSYADDAVEEMTEAAESQLRALGYLD